MSFKTGGPFNAVKIINTFLSLIISANYDKVEEFQPIPYTSYCFSIIESLLYEQLTQIN